MKNYSLFEKYNIDLKDSTIIDVFVGWDVNIEGGLTIIFEKQFDERGFIIFGYTELGEWIEYCQIGNKIIVNLPDFAYSDPLIKKSRQPEIDYIQDIISEYKIK